MMRRISTFCEYTKKRITSPLTQREEHRHEEYRVTHIAQVDVLHRLGGQEDEDDDEHQAVEAVVHVGQGGRAHQHEAERCQHRREHDEQGHERGDRAVL